MNKKGFWYAFVLGFIGLLVLLVNIYVAGTTRVEQEKLSIGQNAMGVMSAFHDRELAVRYFETAGRLSSFSVIRAFAYNGGWRIEPCGSFSGTKFWYDRGKSCIPSRDEMSGQLIEFLHREYYNVHSPRLPVEYDGGFLFFADIKENMFLFEGQASDPLYIPVGCGSQPDKIPAGFWKRPEGVFWPVTLKGYECGAVSLRPSFSNEVWLDTRKINEVEPRFIDQVVDCDGDPEPVSCIKSISPSLPADWEIKAVDEGDNVVALLTVDLGELPGENDPVVLRVGARVSKGVVSEP